MAVDEEGNAIAARLAGDDREPPASARRLLTWLASLEPEQGRDELSVEHVASQTGMHRDQVIEAFRALAAAGAGRFIHGRRGHVSRFRPGDVNLVRVARAIAAGTQAAPLVAHSYRLRPELTLSLTLPSDLSVAEARRIAAFVETLPVEPAPAWPASVRAPRRSGATQPDPDTVVIGMSRLRISLPVMVALEDGLFQREGLRVQLHTFETAQPLMDAIVAGNVPAGGFVAFPISMAAELESGVALRHVSMQIEDDAHPISRLLVRAHAGIRSLSDLRGRRIGILPTFAYRAWLGVLLRDAEVDPASLEIRELSPMSGAAALASGALDALFTNDPAATTALSAGAALLEPDPGVARSVLYPLPFGSFVLNAAFAEARPLVAAAIARALDAAIELVCDDPSRARAALAAHLPEAHAALVRAFPPARYSTTSLVEAEALSRLGARYHELGVLRRPLAPRPLLLA